MTAHAHGQSRTAPSHFRTRWIGGLAAAVAIVWGLCFVLIQTSLPSPTPLLLAALRALIGGGVLAICLVLRNWRRDGLTRRDAPGVAGLRRTRLPSVAILLALALTNAVLALGAMYLAAGRAEAGVASILAGGQPLVLAAAGWAFFGERATLRGVSGLSLAMVGVVVVAMASTGGTSSTGVALALFAAVAPAAGTVLMRRLAPTVDLLLTTSAQFLLGGAILIAVSALVEPWGLGWSPATLPGLLVLGVLGTGLANVAWFWLLGRVSFVRLGTALFLVPVTGIVAAMVIGNRPGPIELVGISFMLAGIGIVSLGGSSTSQAAETG